MATKTETKKPAFNVFAKAKDKAASLPKKGKGKETIWTVNPSEIQQTDDPTIEQLAEAVTQVINLTEERKKIEAKEKVYKNLLRDYAEGQYVDHLAAHGAEPPTPLKVANAEGETVTYVVTDRSHLSKVEDNQVTLLSKLLGEDAAADIIYNAESFAFNPAILALPGVSEAIEAGLNEILGKLVEDETLTMAQAGDLLTHEEVRRFKPGTVKAAVGTCGKDRAKLAQFFEALGSARSHYIKA